MSGIDWLAVNFVVEGARLKLRPAEKAAVMRRLAPKMQRHNEHHPGKLSTEEVAFRLRCSERDIERYLARLPLGEVRTCPVCREPMWVVGGVVEPHPDRLFAECPMSGREMRRGLAAVRPDLYEWLEESC